MKVKNVSKVLMDKDGTKTKVRLSKENGDEEEMVKKKVVLYLKTRNDKTEYFGVVRDGVIAGGIENVWNIRDRLEIEVNEVRFWNKQ